MSREVREDFVTALCLLACGLIGTCFLVGVVVIGRWVITSGAWLPLAVTASTCTALALWSDHRANPHH